MSLHLEVLPTDVWAEAVASEWASRLRARPHARICLPTGSTPRPVYETIDADFSSATVFLLDEFGLPDGDPARCDVMLDRDLLRRLQAPPARFDRLDPMAPDLDLECQRYSTATRGGGLDLTLLGLGRNGHLGLNEPGSEPTDTTRKVTISESTRDGLKRYGADSDASWGLTLGMAELLESREIWLLVTGSHKAEILEGMMKDAVGSSLPATYLRQTDADVVVWADEASASLL